MIYNHHHSTHPAVSVLCSIFVSRDLFFEGHRPHREIAHPYSPPRKLTRDGQEACDSAFLSCLPSLGCIDCFATLELEKIDWAGVTSDTECSDVVSFLNNGGHCSKLNDDREATETFCNAFNACVVWTDNGTGGSADPSDQEGKTTRCRELDGDELGQDYALTSFTGLDSFATRICQLHRVDLLRVAWNQEDLAGRWDLP